MSRKRILLIAAGASLFIILLAAYLFIKPSRQVSINFDRDNLSATISRRSGKSIDKVADINNSSTLRLADGNYTIKTFSKSNVIKENTTNFTVKDKDTTVNIRTEYSQSFITSEVNKYRKNIESVLFAKYPTLKTSYIFRQETLSGKNAEWYAAAYQEKAQAKNSGDSYIVIMKKNGNSWDIKNRPQIVNTIHNTSNIPENVLEDANKLTYF